MKAFVENYNGVLDVVEDALFDKGCLTDNPHEADVFLLWQDVRGVCKDLAWLAKTQLGKPVVVVQHGRGATRDYDIPNKFPLIADKILVWGESEKSRLLKCGIQADKIMIVGCPMFPRLIQKVPGRRGKNILFVPVIAAKEEPENILVYHALRMWESEKVINTVTNKFHLLKKAWAWEDNQLREVLLPNGTKEKRLWKKEVRNNLPRWLVYETGLVNVKLSGIHDIHQYQSPLIVSPQNDPNLVDGIVELLANIDVMVCLEEGTMQLLAHALDIPVIVADIFKYDNYGGCPDYDKVEKIHTGACYWTKNINKLGGIIDHALRNPLELAKPRKSVCEDEGGLSLEDPNAAIIRELKALVERKERESVTA